MTHFKYSILIFLVVCQNLLLTAQSDHIRFDRVSAKYGLPNGNIVEMAEDGFGFLWFATDEGLFRYDGYEFKAYRHDVQDSTTLSHSSLNGVSVDRENRVWVATTYGVNLLDRRTGTSRKLLPYPEEGRQSKTSNHIRKIFADSRQNIWVNRSQMFWYDMAADRFHQVKQKGDPKAGHRVRTFFEDSKGQVWAGTSRGILKLNANDSVFQKIWPDPGPNSPFNSEIKGFSENEDGSFFLATKGGLAKWDHRSKKIEKVYLKNNLDNVPINYLLKDSDGNLWMAFAKNGIGVYHISEKKFTHLTYHPNQANSLNNNAVNCLWEDQFKNIWIGTVNGISKIKMDQAGYNLVQNETGYDNISNHALRVLQDSKGGIWSKTPEGIFHIKKGKINGGKITELNAIKEDIVRGWFLEDHEGGIWISFGAKGIYRRGKGAPLFKKMPLSDSLSNYGINKMLLDKKNKDIVWIGSILGLCRLNWKTGEEKWYIPSDDVPEVSSDRVGIFEQYGEDEIWMYYTYSNSLGRFDKNTGKFELYLPPPEKKHVLEGVIKDIAIGKDGNLWLATAYGLTNFNLHTKEFAIYGKKEGMLENELSIVLIDRQEKIWVCGNRFFSQFDHENKTFHNYDIAKDVMHFHSKSGHVANDGTLLLGSINGIYKFNPQRITKNKKKPSVILTDFKVKNETYLLDGAFEKTTGIILSHHENDISFSFSGIHFINPEANNYKCQLIGFDENWRDLGNEHKISYTNLNPGQYIFKAIASNSDGVWNEEGLKIKLSITPAFWQTLWFRSLIALMLISIGYAIYKNRQHQFTLQRQKEMAEQSAEYKTRFLADVSHEIRTPMNAIIGLSNLTLKSELNQKQSKFISAIQQSSQNLLTIINDLLDHTKLEAGKFTFVKKPFYLSEIIDQLNDTFKYKAEEKELIFELIVNGPRPQCLLGDPTRLLQILTNLLGNAIKFTEQGNIQLHINKTEESEQKTKLQFEIEDTGIGIAKNQLDMIFESFNQADNIKYKEVEGTGLGLSIARQLVEQQGGQLQIESELGKGTKLWFELAFEKGIENKKELKKEAVDFNIPHLKILVVEDNEFNQILILEILETHIEKAEIEMAENGKLALEKLEQQFFDLIIMDVKMPVMDGYEATKAIRLSDNLKLKNTPILAVTASALPVQLGKCKAVGMNDVVTKPIDEIELIEKIVALTKSQQLIDRSKLKKLLANDETRVKRYLNMFKDQCPEQLKQLKKYNSENNMEQVIIIAHNIKSQCLFLGLEKTAEIAIKIEDLASNRNESNFITEFIDELEKEINEVIKRELS